MKKAFITGITGQDGSYLAELLLSKGYEVHGLIRRASTFNTQRIDHIYSDPHLPNAKLHLHYGDLTDGANLTNLIYMTQPDEIYHLGAQSHVRVSFDLPDYTGETAALSTIRLLEAIHRASGVKPRYYQASSSELFGNTPAPQSENSAFRPRSPYAIAKLYGFWAAVNYRESYGLFACNGILFNHESPRRGLTFITRKITKAISAILLRQQDKLYLGNLKSRRDWGFAPEYVECMWRMLQQEQPDDYVIGTGEAHTVEEFLMESFSYVKLDYQKYVAIDPRYYRPTEVDELRADFSKAKEKLNWAPKVTFKDLVRIMVDADMISAGLTPPGLGLRKLETLGMTWTKPVINEMSHVSR